MSKELTKELVIEFWEYIADIYDSTVMEKSESSFMKLTGGSLDLIKVLDKKEFMTKYTTTIGRTIYTPFVVGCVSDKWTFENQISNCVHEHMHVEQYDREGFKFMVNYLLDPSNRAVYEAHAYSTNIEMYFYNTGKTFDAELLSSKLSSYGCSKEDIAIAKNILEDNIKLIESGKIIYKPSMLAIDWLNNNLLN